MKTVFKKVFLVACCLAAAYLAVSGLCRPAAALRHLRCSLFVNQRQAQQAYERGALYLDRNHNGLACEGLPNY